METSTGCLGGPDLRSHGQSVGDRYGPGAEEDGEVRSCRKKGKHPRSPECSSFFREWSMAKHPGRIRTLGCTKAQRQPLAFSKRKDRQSFQDHGNVTLPFFFFNIEGAFSMNALCIFLISLSKSHQSLHFVRVGHRTLEKLGNLPGLEPGVQIWNPRRFQPAPSLLTAGIEVLASAATRRAESNSVMILAQYYLNTNLML